MACMSTVFEKIISGQLPGRFVWADDTCVAFATIAPVSAGHVLVVPRQPWPKWTDMPSEIAAHLMQVAHHIGSAQEAAFGVPRSGLVIAGFEVPHTHVHVIPLRTEADVNLANARQTDAAELDRAMETLRTHLLAAGHHSYVPPSLNSLSGS